ncbi:MAG: DNA helicase II [Hydrogenophilales bacterium CG03_land_8_20_14_0_80_62_28]|nr:UvrD-helicase domain-containing protein [Betaproteobacteria bacterium]PIV23536.1 MAG: DNA helicase II [Hydrogenophilales bacterium CG03_land_8_20_14_0_80_62_28]PIX00752.1 MAG: DNA helicase II [Hydrogenophilales bacterium CG_4_8_14_3_um_filter_62_83]
MSSDLLGGLNPDQLAAVTANGSALVLAGAGSGKTRVLTTRIAWLIQTAQVSPMGLLAVTFTNKAAKEMLTRLSAMLPINTRGMWVGTFHGLCNRLLRAHHRDAGLPSLFQILDSADQLSAIKRLLKALNIDTDKYQPRKVQAFINQNKEAGLRADRVEAWDPYSRRLVELFAEYDAQCNREGAVDFAELLLRSYELLARNALLREHYQTRFRHILVDEFQDTSKLQYAWLRLLAGPDTALFAVGDDDQSIYAFRGADVGNMAVFMRDLGLTEPIKLTQNYRSHSTILDAANAVISGNENRLGKDLWTDAGVGEPIRHYQANDDREEAGFVVEAIRELYRDGLGYSNMAVLYRANAQSRAIEHALFTAGLPYRVYGGQRFFERAEIKHALAYLRLVANPEDDNALLRVANFPTRGIGARTLEMLDAAARQGGVTLWQAACAGGGRHKGLAGFVQLIEALRAETANLPLPEAAAIVVERSGLLAHYQTEKEGESRIENLNELTNAASAFASESDDPSLTAFLAHAALEAGDHEAGASADAVQLMTVHAAKGLEFHTVFITGLEEGLFPHENALNEAGGLEEERRLMYVAITRARRRLFISHAEQRMLHGQLRYGLPSRFLEEIPAALVHTLNLRPSPTYAAPAAQSVAIHAPPPSRALPYKIGARVSHPRYGEGVVSGYQGQGAEAEIRVGFPKVGDKWFILDYVKLTAC